MNLRGQRRIASEIFGIGVRRVWIDPEKAEEVSEAITRDDIRILIEKGVILPKPEKGTGRGRTRETHYQMKRGRRKGHGSRRGTKSARVPKKESWTKKIRAIRDELRKMKAEKKIDEPTYRRLYRQARGNLFHSRRHLREHIERAKSG